MKKEDDYPGEDAVTRQMLRDFEAGKFVPVKNQKKARAVARRMATRYLKEHKLDGAALRKNARVNIRLWATDLEKLKTRAEEEGLPYQTLIASIIHKYVSGRLVSKNV